VLDSRQDLPKFNENILGTIEVLKEFRRT